MSKRVYEIARELDLESKEVISRLREAGVEVKSHSSSVASPRTRHRPRSSRA